MHIVILAWLYINHTIGTLITTKVYINDIIDNNCNDVNNKNNSIPHSYSRHIINTCSCFMYIDTQSYYNTPTIHYYINFKGIRTHIAGIHIVLRKHFIPIPIVTT